MIKLRTFGPPLVLDSDGSRAQDLVRQPKRLALLVYLATGEAPYRRRDDLLAVFWPESDAQRARNCLRQSLHHLRSHLGPDVLLGSGDQEVGLSPAALQCDASVFEQELRNGCPERALALYAGPFLESFFLTDLAGFDDWVETRRRHYRNLAVSACRDLAHRAEGARDLGGALYWWQEAARFSPLDEFVVRRVVALLVATGRRNQALGILGDFIQRLRVELEVEPSREILDLLDAVLETAEPRLPPWFGDRRSPQSAGPAGHWRRTTDVLPL